MLNFTHLPLKTDSTFGFTFMRRVNVQKHRSRCALKFSTATVSPSGLIALCVSVRACFLY